MKTAIASIVFGAAGALAAPAVHFLNLAQLSTAAGPFRFYFEVTDLVTHAAPKSAKANVTDSATFTVTDKSYTGPNGTTQCSVAWDPNGGEYDYFNPTYNFCKDESFGFRINNGTLENIETFQLEIQHTYETNQSAPWYYTYFALLNVTEHNFHCRKSGHGTDCKQKGPPAQANITMAIG